MKILLVHNRYQQYGGEDATYESEKEMLEAYGHDVRSLIFDNNHIVSFEQKLKVAVRMIYNRNSAKLTEEIIDVFKPDIIHVHNFFYIVSPSIFYSAHKNKIPIVVTLQNYRLICAGGLLMRDSRPCELCVHDVFPLPGIRYGCHRNSIIGTAHLTINTGIHKLLGTWNKKITRYIAVTEFGRNKYINSSLKLDPLRIVVKPSSVSEGDPIPVEERQDYFLFVGRLSQEKGVEVLLKSFEKTGLPLEIIGDGPLKPLVEKYASKNKNITYSGYSEKAYILSRLRSCRAMVFPSIWYECLPITILEAFSTGTPVIISNVGNLNEIVSNNYTGLHFKPNDPEDLQDVLESFAANHMHYKSLYQNARKVFLEKYTHEVNYQNLMNIYTDAIDDLSKENSE